MKKKIAFIDMDGTLLKNRRTISDTQIEYLKKASEAVELVICTGRSIADCKLVLDRCPFIRYIVASNGAYAKDLHENKIIFNYKMSKRSLKRLCKYVIENNLKYSLHQDMKQYVNIVGDYPEEADTILEGDVYEFIENNDISQLTLIGPGIPRMVEAKKFVLKYSEYSIQNQSMQLVKYLDNPESVVSTTDDPIYYFMDITKAKANKGVGVKAVIKYLGYKIEDTIAIGNGMNDVPMFKVVGMPVAVDNAFDEIKAHTKKVIESNINDGVGKYLVTGKKHLMYDRDLCYTNQLRIAMRNDMVAEIGIDILVERLLCGFDYDKLYNFSPSLKMAENLYVEGNEIALWYDCGCYIPMEANGVLTELMEILATELKEEAFSCECWNNEDESDSDFEAHYENGVLKIKSILYPNGYTEFLICDDYYNCDGEIVLTIEYDPNKRYYCPICGKEVDLTEQYKNAVPITIEKEIIIK